MANLAAIFMEISVTDGILNLIAFSVIILIVVHFISGIAGNLLEKQQTLLKVSKPEDSNSNGTAEANKTKYDVLPGIPFFVKKQIFIQKTTYLEPLINVKLKFKVLENKNVKDVKNSEKLVKFSEYNNDIVASLEEEIERELSRFKELEEFNDWSRTLKATFNRLNEYKPNSPSPDLSSNDLILETNTISKKLVVDYEEKYFINQMQPIIGSAEMSIELASDGTLSKSVSKADDKTVETIVGDLPSDLFGPISASKAEGSGEAKGKTSEIEAQLASDGTPYLFDPSTQENVPMDPKVAEYLKLIMKEPSPYKFDAMVEKEIFYMRHILAQEVNDTKLRDPLKLPIPASAGDKENHIDYNLELVGKLTASSTNSGEEKPNLTIGLKMIEEDKKE